MRAELSSLSELMRQNTAFAYCRLVATRGSTPQKAGAVMLIQPSGEQIGTLGGGCVEAEVKRESLVMIADSKKSVWRFDLDQDYGWDDGLICGGRMEVLIDAECTPESLNYYAQLSRIASEKEGLTEVVSVDSEESGLSSGAAVLFDTLGNPVAARGCEDHSVPDSISSWLEPLDTRPAPYLKNGLSFLPLPQRCRLVIIGGGHVGLAVAELAKSLDFDLWILDDRIEFVEESRFPMASHRISGDLDEILPELPLTSSTYVLIVTRGHRHDQTALYHLAKRELRYLGMIGSKRKIRLIFDNLIDEGIPPEALAGVYAPLGLDIGSRTVEEIAVSICAELVSHRNQQGLLPGRSSPNRFSSDLVTKS